MRINTTEKIRSIAFRNATPILLGILLLFVLIRMPLFFSVGNLLALGSQMVVFGLMSIGMTMLILTGCTDISVGAQLYLGGITAVRVYKNTGSFIWAGLSSIFVCMIASAINGVTIAKFGVPSIIATLAMQQICNGSASLITGDESVIIAPASYRALGQGKIFDAVPLSLVIFLVLFFVGVIIMEKTKFGRYVYAIGNNTDAIAASGLNVFKYRMVIFLITGFLCGLAALINTSRIGSSQFGMGVGMEFSCIAAVVVGGTSMLGGSGKMIGTLLGIAVIASIDQLLRLFNVSPYLYNVVWGIIVLFTVSMDLLKRAQERRDRELRIVQSMVEK